MKAVANKQEMYKLLRSGAFGNTARSWSSYAELLASDYRGLVGVRSLVTGGPFLAHVPFDKVPKTANNYSEMQDDSNILLQGEIYRSEMGLYLYASKVQRHMRLALAEGGESFWLSRARVKLQTALWPSDYDDLMLLLDEYPESVVEFSAYSRAVGNIPNRNTIIWEVRNY